MEIQYDALSITTGMLLLFLISYALISAYTAIYLKFSKGKKIKKKNFLLAMAVVSLAWFVSTIFAAMFASSYGVLTFGGVSMVLIFGFNFFITEKMLNLSGRDKIFYCVTLVAIINPVWLSVLGII